MAALIAFLVLALVIGLTVGLGAPWLVLLPFLAILAVVVWLGALAVLHRSPEEAVRRTRPVEHLGPGGPDDPDRDRPRG